MNQVLKIGITDCGKYENYRKWLDTEPGVEPVKLSMNLQNEGDVDFCDGILFTGGEDVHPELYGKPEYLEEYELKEIIPARDKFEYNVIERALELKKPVLGICRGLQLIKRRKARSEDREEKKTAQHRLCAVCIALEARYASNQRGGPADLAMALRAHLPQTWIRRSSSFSTGRSVNTPCAPRHRSHRKLVTGTFQEDQGAAW